MAGEKRIAIVQPAVPDYRQPLFDRLAAIYKGRFHVYAGGCVGAGTIRTIGATRDWLVPLRNHFMLGERLLWQHGHEDKLFDADLVILSGSLRTLSSLRLLAGRRRRRAATLLWGHIRGKHRAVVPLRHLQVWASEGFIAYTDHDAAIARRMLPEARVWTASNSCVWRRECVAQRDGGQEPHDIVCVGRLVSAKKPALLIDAFARLVATAAVPRTTTLVFVGDGPLGDMLKRRAQTLGLAGRVAFRGHVWQPEDLWPVYDQALVAVSPGYVGLAAIQAFARGVTLVVSRNEPHAPEIVACRAGFNSHFFDTDDPADLAATIAGCFMAADELRSRRPAIAAHTADRFTYDVMIDGFRAAIEACR